MMDYQQFYTGTDIAKCGRGKELKAIGARVLACESGLTVPKVIAVLTAATGWGWKKGKKHGDHPTENFSIRLQTVRTLVQQAIADLNALGVDGTSISRAALSYEKKKQGKAKGGLKSLEKGYGFERKDFEAAKKGADKDALIMPRAGSRVAEVLKGAKDKMANYNLQRAQGLNVHNTLVQAVGDDQIRNLLLTKDITQLKDHEIDTVLSVADDMGAQNTAQVHFLRKTERVGQFLTWCENHLFYKTVGLPHTSAGREIYAMDRYGNLITMAPTAFFKPNSRTYGANGSVQHNHSSLNAGADVISAGEIEFNAGRITHIDNRSGHYKPTAKQVQQCVFSLRMADDADLSQLHIEVFHKGQEQTFNDVGLFLAARF